MLKKKGSLDRNEFKNCVQSLGENLNKQELEDLFTKADKDKSNTIAFDEFVNIMAQKMTDTDSLEEVIKAFKTLSGNRPYVVAENLTDVVKPDLIDYLKTAMRKKEVTVSGEEPPSNPLDYETLTKAAIAR